MLNHLRFGSLAKNDCAAHLGVVALERRASVAARDCKRERPSPVALVHNLDVERKNNAIAITLLW